MYAYRIRWLCKIFFLSSSLSFILLFYLNISILFPFQTACTQTNRRTENSVNIYKLGLALTRREWLSGHSTVLPDYYQYAAAPTICVSPSVVCKRVVHQRRIAPITMWPERALANRCKSWEYSFVFHVHGYELNTIASQTFNITFTSISLYIRWNSLSRNYLSNRQYLSYQTNVACSLETYICFLVIFLYHHFVHL